MKPWLFIIALLAGCAAHPGDSLPVGYSNPVSSLARAATEMEMRCGLAAGSLLHPDAEGNLEVHAASVDVSYSQFSCVMDAIGKAKLTDRGVKIIMSGEDAALS